jgi:fumarate hydratase class I
MPGELENAIFELVRRTACELPDDVVAALRRARDAEAPGSAAEITLSIFLQNIDMAHAQMKPACQDTGLPYFFIHHPQQVSKRKMTQVIHDVMIRVTRQQYLRPNAVDAVTGKNSGVNIGAGFPAVYFDEWDDPAVEIALMLKGGGSENVGRQYSLPFADLDAGRDLEGVRRVALDAVRRAEGKGCPPGIWVFSLGGDRVPGFA